MENKNCSHISVADPKGFFDDLLIKIADYYDLTTRSKAARLAWIDHAETIGVLGEKEASRARITQV